MMKYLICPTKYSNKTYGNYENERANSPIEEMVHFIKVIYTAKLLYIDYYYSATQKERNTN